MSNLLRLKKILRDPEQIDLNNAWVALDDATHPNMLVHGEELAGEILKSDAIAPAHLINYFKQLLHLPDAALASISDLFEFAPLLLEGEAHRKSKIRFTAKCKSLEDALETWLADYTKEYFRTTEALLFSDPAKFVIDYLDGTFKRMLSHDLAIQPELIPPLPERLFTLYPTEERLLRINESLRALILFMENQLRAIGRPPEDAKVLVPLYILGIEPMEMTLIYGLIQTPSSGETWEPSELFREAAAVNLFSRVVVKDVKVLDLDLVKGQSIYIAPHLLHLNPAREPSSTRKSFSFGSGPYFCAGRSIALKIADNFLAAAQSVNPGACRDLFRLRMHRHNVNLQIKVEKNESRSAT